MLVLILILCKPNIKSKSDYYKILKFNLIKENFFLKMSEYILNKKECLIC